MHSAAMAAVAHVFSARRISDTSLFSFLFDTRRGWIRQPGVPPPRTPYSAMPRAMRIERTETIVSGAAVGGRSRCVRARGGDQRQQGLRAGAAEDAQAMQPIAVFFGTCPAGNHGRRAHEAGGPDGGDHGRVVVAGGVAEP